MNTHRRFFLLSILLMIAALLTGISCKHWERHGTFIPSTDSIHKPANSIYYWRTVFQLSDKEKEFLKEENIERIYLRMFDVSTDDDTPIPDASISFADSVPRDMEIVPTVFITVKAMSAMNDDERVEVYADKIVKRVTAMCSWHDIENWHELQLDCDWTGSTRDAFYLLCAEVKKRLGNKTLSSTIRLHQLSQPAPPVDYGVLMVYNTDNFADYNVQNSILNSRTVKQYVDKKLTFDLPLDIALPIYQWDLVFYKGLFRRIAARGEVPDSTENVRHEQVSYEEVRTTQELLNHHLHLDGKKHSTILYHLDSININSYSHEQIESIFNN